MDPGEVRKAANESLFREVNERIEASANHFDVADKLEFVCECGDAGCTARIALSLAEYEEARANPARFVVARGHEDAEVDGVVEPRGSYTLVEKVGEARSVAEAEDPRS